MNTFTSHNDLNHPALPAAQHAPPHGLTRRTLGALSVLSALTGLGLPTMSTAQGKPPEEGLDFVKLDKPAPTEAVKGKIDVVEFFWYNCPHCNTFEPRLSTWLTTLPKDVHFRRIPVAFRPEFVPQQHLYFSLEALGLVEALHQKVFYAIHVEKLDLSQRAGILAWVGKQAVKGLDINQFTQTFDSFAVASKATRATQLQTSYKVTGVPSIGIAGQFYTDGALAQSMDRALQVTNYLLGTQRKKQA